MNRKAIFLLSVYTKLCWTDLLRNPPAIALANSVAASVNTVATLIGSYWWVWRWNRCPLCSASYLFLLPKAMPYGACPHIRGLLSIHTHCYFTTTCSSFHTNMKLLTPVITQLVANQPRILLNSSVFRIPLL